MASQDFWNLQSKFRGKKEFNFYDKMVPQPFRVTPTPTPSLGPQVAAFLEPCCCDYTTDCGITPLFGRFNYVSGMKANFWDASAEPFLSGQTVVNYNETTVDVSGVTYIIDQWISNSFPLNVDITPSIYEFNGGCSVVREDECSYTYKKVLFEDCCSGEQVFFSSNADYIVTGQTYGIYDDKCYSAIEIYPTNDPLLPILIIDDNTNANPCIACNSLREIICPTPTPTPSITATVTPSPSITATLTPTPSITATATPSISISPTITPTSSITATPSITPTINVSITPTPSITPSPTPFIASVNISPTGTTKYNFISLTGSTNISSPTYVWTLSDFYDYSGNTITSYTGQTTPVGEFRESGTTLVDLTVTGLDTYGNPVTGSSTNFDVIVPTTYRMWFNEVGTTNLYYTDDLITFSSTTLPNSFIDSVRSSITYSPVLDMYVLGERNGAYYSYDGVNWSATTIGVTARMRKIIWVPKFQMFATISDAGNYFLYSYNGINWNNAGTFAWGNLGSDVFLWDDVNELFIMHDESGDIWTSSNGTSWSLTQSYSGNRFDGLITYKGRNTYVDSDGTILYSDDGLSWSAGSSTGVTTGGVWSANVLPNGRRFTTGTVGVSQGNWSISDNGVNWSGLTSPTGTTANTFSAIYNETEGKIVINGANLLLLVSSDNGETYSEITGPSAQCNSMGIKYNIT